MGDQISVIIITVPTNEVGDAVEAIFHEGTETLIDMNVKHVCTCGHHH
jgi:predicted dinucleotide-binding enzyme